MRTELFVSRSAGRTFVATREDGSTVELRVERDDARPAVGRVIKARVEAVMPGIQSAFLDAGLDKSVFLHAADLLLPGDAAPHAPIEDRLAEGRELLVQVSRDPIGSKGARVTCEISLPGRYLVHTPLAALRGISRRIADPEERERLRALVDGLPESWGGFIVRTAAAGVPEERVRADADRLRESWEAMQLRAQQAGVPGVVHEDLELPLRVLRDLDPAGVERIVIDCPEFHARARRYLEPLDPALAARLALHEGPSDLLEESGLDVDIERALRRQVWLPSGGTLVIEQTEALVSVDVNTGKFAGKGGVAQTILHTNLEAAREIARQLRLRDLGGIIVIDFIDMTGAEHRSRVLDELAEALRADRARTKLAGMSELGLVQLTRKRTRPGPEVVLTRVCPSCAGAGRVKDARTVCDEALAEVRRLRPLLAEREIRVRVHPEVADTARRFLERPAGPGHGPLCVEEDASIGPDHFDVVAW